MATSRRLGVRTTAILTLLLLAAIGAAGLAYPAPAATPVANGSGGPGGLTDAKMFATVVARLRSGAPYYPTMGSELRNGHYPTRDVFNWRTPLHLVALATAPWAAWRGVLTALLVGLFAFTMATTTAPRAVKWTAAVAQLGVLVTLAATDAIYVSEVWAGTLIGISVCAYALRLPVIAVVTGLLALFVRELAAPYCLSCALLAAHRRRWRECGAWIGGACAYALYYGWHLMNVSAQRLPEDVSHASSWIEFGGLSFLQTTIDKLGWLSFLPDALTAGALVLIVAGVLHSGAPLQVRITSATYAAFFLVVGKPFNDYWGWMAAPTWAISCAYGVDAVHLALRAAATPSADNLDLKP